MMSRSAKLDQAYVRQGKRRETRWLSQIVVVAVLLGSLISGGCAELPFDRPPISPGGIPSALDPQGPGAAHIADLWWLMFWLSMLIVLLIFGIIGYVLVRRPQANPQTPIAPDDNRGHNWLIWGGIVLPLVILAVVFGFTMRTFAAVDNSLDNAGAKITVDIIGRRWWWEVAYPEQNVITANELHIPVGVPVTIRLASADVIHSFWVPKLHGKMDLIPGKVNSIVIQADEPGLYRGMCAEFCGVQHSHMGFMVVAESQVDFDAWLLAQAQPASPVEDALALRGQAVFLEAGCAYCHVIRGLDDSAIDASAVDLGPDLTHLDSRLTLAAATLWNTPGNLAGWISNAQHIKPGSLMPPIFIPSEDLQALLAYLESLE